MTPTPLVFQSSGSMLDMGPCRCLESHVNLGERFSLLFYPAFEWVPRSLSLSRLTRSPSLSGRFFLILQRSIVSSNVTDSLVLQLFQSFLHTSRVVSILLSCKVNRVERSEDGTIPAKRGGAFKPLQAAASCSPQKLGSPQLRNGARPNCSLPLVGDRGWYLGPSRRDDTPRSQASAASFLAHLQPQSCESHPYPPPRKLGTAVDT
ncbi:hypothetical protein N658DRAFT_117787 [Parathielavia hyrcaniae]|uniref:Uncharacterized protein n=1 Tax=Parathielavia hyrcaniae TaxID=113614 RepID=A0AAN6T5W4_9PEZI|nr:hypothetical protein N658DRAFT_117787 [Parathielavia hyrcaniae]